MEAPQRLCPCSARRPKPNGNASGNNLRPVPVREKTLRAQCELADRNVQQIFDEVLRVHNREPQGLCLLALGGYGRKMLFPYSDLDILFLLGNERVELESRQLISEFFRGLVGYWISRQFGGAHIGRV